MKRLLSLVLSFVMILMLCACSCQAQMVLLTNAYADDQKCFYRDDGQIDILYERDGKHEIEWFYVYDDDDCLMYRMREVRPMTNLTDPNSGKDTYRLRKFWILDDCLENVVKFTLIYRVNDTCYGDGELLLRTTSSYDDVKQCFDGWRDIVHNEETTFSYSAGAYIKKTVTFDYPRDLWAFSCSNIKGAESSGYGTAEIASAWVADYSVVDGSNGSKHVSNDISNVKSNDSTSGINVGDTVVFGSYEQDDNSKNGNEPIEWTVLEKEGNKALLISKYCLDYVNYNNADRAITWENCTLRTWLNSIFINEAFTEEEIEVIIDSTVTADENPEYGTSAGKNTTDKLFLLSIVEVENYFKSNEDRLCKPTQSIILKGSNVASINGNCWWWLRTPGDSQNYAALVTDRGTVSALGNYVYNSDGVRPAMWINIDSILADTTADEVYTDSYDSEVEKVCAFQIEYGLYCFNVNNNGTIEFDPSYAKVLPEKFVNEIKSLTDVKSITMLDDEREIFGNRYFAAIHSDGSVSVVDLNCEERQEPSTLESEIEKWTNIKKLVADTKHINHGFMVCGITTDGKVKVCGDYFDGPDTKEENSKIPEWNNIERVIVGCDTIIAIDTNGKANGAGYLFSEACDSMYGKYDQSIFDGAVDGYIMDYGPGPQYMVVDSSGSLSGRPSKMFNTLKDTKFSKVYPLDIETDAVLTTDGKLYVCDYSSETEPKLVQSDVKEFVITDEGYKGGVALTQNNHVEVVEFFGNSGYYCRQPSGAVNRIVYLASQSAVVVELEDGTLELLGFRQN